MDIGSFPAKNNTDLKKITYLASEAIPSLGIGSQRRSFKPELIGTVLTLVRGRKVGGGVVAARLFHQLHPQ